jgi:HEAT repeat protein
MRPSIRNAALLGALTLGLWATPAQATATVHEQRRELLVLLNAHEFRVDARVLQRIGPQVPKLLVEISSVPDHRPTVRNHALMALAVFPTVQTRRYLESLLLERSLKGSPTGTLLRRQALRSLGRAFKGEVVVAIANLKNDPDPQIRIAVAQALGDTASPRARPILAAWLPHEKDLGVRLAVDVALERFRTRPGR